MTARHEGPSTATILRIFFTVVAAALVLYAAYSVRSVLLLLLVSGFLAVGLDPGVRRLEGLGLRRGQAVALIFAGVVALLAAFAIAVVPPLASQVTQFATELPEYIAELADENPRIRELVVENDIPQRLGEATSNVPALVGSSLGGVLGIVGSVAGALFNVVTVLILTIYFLVSLSKIREGSLGLVPRSKRERVRDLSDPILEKIGGYISGQATVALTAGVLAFAFLAIAGVPFPVALALWVTISTVIPLVGATIGAIPAIIVAFFDSTGIGIATLVYFIAYQQIENYVIAPRIMTKAVDISPAGVLVAALIGGTLLGFVGALIAIPTAASLKLITEQVLRPRAEAS